jgi:hypothetical protein
MSERFCTNCGTTASNDPAVRFCGICGRALTTSVAASVLGLNGPADRPMRANLAEVRTLVLRMETRINRKLEAEAMTEEKLSRRNADLEFVTAFRPDAQLD